MRDLVAQRVYQIACAYEDGNDANALRRDALFKLGLERKPLDAAMDLASAPTFSRLENGVSARDLYRMARAFVETFIASYDTPPPVIVLDMTTPRMPPTVRRSSLSTTTITATTAPCRCFSSRASRASSSPRCCDQASAPRAWRTP